MLKTPIHRKLTVNSLTIDLQDMMFQDAQAEAERAYDVDLSRSSSHPVIVHSRIVANVLDALKSNPEWLKELNEQLSN